MSKYRNTVFDDFKSRFLVVFFSVVTGTVQCWKHRIPTIFLPKSRNTVLKIFTSCPPVKITSPLEYPYIEILSRGGLTVPSLNLANYVSTTFAVLDFSYGAVSKCGLSSRIAAETVLKHVFNSFQTFTYEAHESAGQTFTNCTTTNIYLNNQRKISTDALVAD